MSLENIEIVERVLDAWNRADVETVLALADPDVEYVNSPGAVEPGTRRGHDGLADVVRKQWESFPGSRQEIVRHHDRGEEVLVEARMSWLMPGSESQVDIESLISWTVRRGKIVRCEVLGAGSDVPSALAAAGLSRKRDR
jgi:ketosteroid isomerase-like protein